MNPIELSGEAHIASTVAAYDVGTDTSKLRPVAVFNAAASMSPPAMMSSAATEGTYNT